MWQHWVFRRSRAAYSVVCGQIWHDKLYHVTDDPSFATLFDYRKVPKFSDARKLGCKLPKIQTNRPNLRVFCQTDANGKANSEDPDQTAPLGAVWSGPALFAQTYLSENLESLYYGSLRVHFSWTKHMTL